MAFYGRLLIFSSFCFQDKVDAGMPTAMAVSSLIAIGTSHGLVLVFGMLDWKLIFKSFELLTSCYFNFNKVLAHPSHWIVVNYCDRWMSVVLCRLM